MKYLVPARYRDFRVMSMKVNGVFLIRVVAMVRNPKKTGKINEST